MTSLTTKLVEVAAPEFFGVYLFALLGGASSNVASGVGLNGAFGNAIALTSILYMLSNDPESGKLNSAVSLMHYLTAKSKEHQSSDGSRKINGIQTMLLEVAMQVTGGLAAGASLKHLLPDPKTSCFEPTVSNSHVFVWELLGTFLLLGVISATGNRYQQVAPLAIGLALFAGAQAAGPFTGAAFNPARYLANLGAGCSVNKAGFYVGAHIVAACGFAVIVYIERYLMGVRSEAVVQAPQVEDYPVQEFKTFGSSSWKRSKSRPLLM